MNIITLTTDLGLKDPYAAAVKGFLLSNIPDSTIVDITHLVSPFNVSEAAYILRNAYSEFPDKTIHLINVDSNNPGNGNYIAVKFQRQYFIGADNGVISLITDGQADEISVIDTEHQRQKLFPLKNIIAPAAVRLSKKFNMSSVGKASAEFTMISSLNAVVEQNMIRGMVIYIDNYGNAVTNISRKIFDRFNGFKRIKVEFRGGDYLDNIVSLYSDVCEGDALCLFNSGGLLEIAINKGNASKLLGLQLKNTVLVEFIDFE